MTGGFGRAARRRLTPLVALVLLLAWGPSLAAASRVVAVGDIHGSLTGLVEILRTAHLVDAEDNWAGGDATLVQQGDMLDRGTKVREVMDLLRRLQTQAPASGGRVVVLLGNHEAMNVLGIVRDVNPGAYAEFTDRKSERRQKTAFKRFKQFWRDRAHALGRSVDISKKVEEQWMAMRPPGFVEYARDLGPDGEYGRWLRSLPAAVVIGDTLFVHAGYGPEMKGTTVADINRRAASELEAFDEMRSYMVKEGLGLPWYSVMDLAREARREIEAADAAAAASEPPADPARVLRARRLERILGWQKWLVTDPAGPLWWRGAATWEASPEHEAEIASLLDGLDVARMVVGHTPESDGRIHARFGGRVLLIDTGMLASVYDGRPSALEISDGHINAIYLDGIRPPVADAQPPPAADVPDLAGAAPPSY